MEALAAGLPVITTQVGALPEAVTHGETGLIVPADDANALAEALLPLHWTAPCGGVSAVTRGRQHGTFRRTRRTIGGSWILSSKSHTPPDKLLVLWQQDCLHVYLHDFTLRNFGFLLLPESQ